MTFLKSLITTLLALTALSAAAGPVTGRRVQAVQPGGKSFTIVVNGDEFRHSFTDEHGHAVIKGSDGYYYYASYSSDGTIYSTGHLVGETAPASVLSASLKRQPVQASQLRRRQIQKTLSARTMRRAKAQAAGNGGVVRRHSIILLVEFQDTKMQHSKSDFERLITERGYSLNGATGCAAEYFEDQLGGEYEFTYTVSDIITLSRDCKYYFQDDDKGYIDLNAHKAVKEACELAAASGIDFSQFDDDGDGYVDNVFLFVAGRDEAESAAETDLPWSHQSYLHYYYSPDVVQGGKKIDNYALTTELRLVSTGISSKYILAGIGTFCHEYSHTLGLADLYDTDYEENGYSNAVWGCTNLMDTGSYNNNGDTPPHYSAIEYECAGVTSHRETLAPGRYSLEPISKNRRYLKMETGNPGEFWLIECRTNASVSGPSRWDKYIGGKGLLVYHIDQSQNPAGTSATYQMDMTAALRWSYNEVNCLSSHQCAYLLSATPGLSAYVFQDNVWYSNRSEVKKVFYPTSKNNSLTSESDPAFVFWDGSESPLAITDIKLSGENVTFTVRSTAEMDLPEIIPGDSEIFQDAAILQWTSDDPEYNEPAYLSYCQSDGTLCEPIEVQPYAPGKYAYTIEGLKTRTAYKTEICFMSDGFFGHPASVNFTTKTSYGSYAYMFLNNVARNEDQTFPTGSRLPLRLYNAGSGAKVKWYFNDKEIHCAADGYYSLNSSGTIKAVLEKSNGETEIISKYFRVK